MAGHLQKAGHNVTVYNRNGEKSAKWAATYGGSAAATPREAADGADIVMMCVGNDKRCALRRLWRRWRVRRPKAGAVLVDHTTASAALARELMPPPKHKARVSSMPRSPAVRQALKTASWASCAAATWLPSSG